MKTTRPKPRHNLNLPDPIRDIPEMYNHPLTKKAAEFNDQYVGIWDDRDYRQREGGIHPEADAKAKEEEEKRAARAKAGKA